MEPTTDERDHTDRPRRPYKAPRVGDSRAPITTLIVLAVAAVAVIIGFVILSSISGESTRSPTAETVSAPATSTPISVVDIPTAAPTTTTVAAPTAGKGDAPLLVVNASGVRGSATTMLAQLAADGYAAKKLANAKGGRLEQTVVYYVAGDAAAESVARLLATQIRQAQVQPMPDPPPIDRPLNGATVALMIGRDIAGRSLAELAAG
jgi:hypothetical protein